MIEVSRGRGLDDLMADHERELPFLDAYASNSHEDIETQITRMLGQPDSKGWSQGVMAIDASTLTVRVTSPAALPLVVSDLHVEGFTKGHLSQDRREAHARIEGWTPAVERFLERMVEFSALADGPQPPTSS